MKKLIMFLIGIVAFTYSVKAQSGATARATADITGNKTFNVGAILDVPASTPAGVYTGTFDVVVALQ